MKTNLQQAWQHQKHMKDSDYLHRSQSYRLLSLLTVKTNYELLRVGQQPCFNLSYCTLIFLELPNISSTSLHFYFAMTAVIADRGKGIGIMLAKDQRVPSQDSFSNLTEPTHSVQVTTVHRRAGSRLLAQTHLEDGEQRHSGLSTWADADDVASLRVPVRQHSDKA